MNKDNKKALWLFLFILGISIFFVMVYLLISDNISEFDNYIYDAISKLISKPMTIMFVIITYLSSTWFLLTGILLVLILSKDKKKAFYICLNIGLCCLINQILKFVFCRNRPVGINIITEKGFSFPSGHSMASLAFYGLWIYIINGLNWKKTYKFISIIMLSILILLIGISRIYLGVHYASDVLAGFSLSFAYLIIYIKFIYKRRVT